MPAPQKQPELMNIEQYNNLPEDSHVEVFDSISHHGAMQEYQQSKFCMAGVQSTTEYTKWKIKLLWNFPRKMTQTST